MSTEGNGSRDTSQWPSPPPDRQVVLHAHVMSDDYSGHVHVKLPCDSRYWLVQMCLRRDEQRGVKCVGHNGDAVIRISDHGRLDREVLEAALAICSRYHVRLWHGHDYRSNLLGVMLRPLWPMKLVTTLHASPDHALTTDFRDMVARWLLPYYQHVICPTVEVAGQVQQLGVPSERLTVYPDDGTGPIAESDRTTANAANGSVDKTQGHDSKSTSSCQQNQSQPQSWLSEVYDQLLAADGWSDLPQVT